MKLKLTIEERKNISHALDHLLANKVDDASVFSGWYQGNKENFIKRHKKAKAFLQSLLEVSK